MKSWVVIVVQSLLVVPDAEYENRVILSWNTIACEEDLHLGDILNIEARGDGKAGGGAEKGELETITHIHHTSPSALRAEASSRFQYDPPENQIWHTDESSLSQKEKAIFFLYRSPFSQWGSWRYEHRVSTIVCRENQGRPAMPVINQLWLPERHFSANGISLRLGEVQMKIYERSLQALPSSAPCGFAASSRVNTFWRGSLSSPK